MITKLFLQFIDALTKTQIKDALKIFMEISSAGNGYLQVAAPWNLMKKNSENADPEKAQTVLHVLCAFVRFIGALAEPFMPSFSAKLYEIMNVKYEGRETTLYESIYNYITENKDKEDYLFLMKLNLVCEGQQITNPLPLFKKSKFIIILHNI